MDREREIERERERANEGGGGGEMLLGLHKHRLEQIMSTVMPLMTPTTGSLLAEVSRQAAAWSILLPSSPSVGGGGGRLFRDLDRQLGTSHCCNIM